MAISPNPLSSYLLNPTSGLARPLCLAVDLWRENVRLSKHFFNAPVGNELEAQICATMDFLEGSYPHMDITSWGKDTIMVRMSPCADSFDLEWDLEGGWTLDLEFDHRGSRDMVQAVLTAIEAINRRVNR